MKITKEEYRKVAQNYGAGISKEKAQNEMTLAKDAYYNVIGFFRLCSKQGKEKSRYTNGFLVKRAK